jgi:hypothetical protein
MVEVDAAGGEQRLRDELRERGLVLNSFWAGGTGSGGSAVAIPVELCLCTLMRVESNRYASSVVGVRECEERSPKEEVGSIKEEAKGHDW